MSKGRSYTRTEEKYKGGAKEVYVTYDLEQQTRGEESATYPKVKRVYVPGHIEDWAVGEYEKRTGKRAHGVKVTYSKSREAFEVERDGTNYEVPETETTFAKIVEVPENAQNVTLRTDLPKKYEDALQSIR